MDTTKKPVTAYSFQDYNTNARKVNPNLTEQQVLDGYNTAYETKQPSVITNQTSILQSTASQDAKDQKTGTTIDQKATSIATGSATGDKYTPPTGAIYDPGSRSFLDSATRQVLKEGVNYDGTPVQQINAGQNSTGSQGGQTTKTEAPALAAPDGKALKTTAPAGFDYQLPEPGEGKSYLYTDDGQVYTKDATGKITVDPIGQKEYEKNVKANKEIAERNALYDTYKTGLDTTHQALIDSIKEAAIQQKTKMEELNKRTLGLKTVAGYRTGGAEYTSEIQNGILKDEEQQGMDRIAEIDANMRLALAQAMSAKTEKDFELANKRLDMVNALQKQKEETIQGIYKAYADNLKFVSDQLKAAKIEERAVKDQALQELKIQGSQLVKEFDGLKTDKEKQAYLDTISKKTGLDAQTILGQINDTRLDVKGKNSIIDKRDSSGDGSAGYKFTSTDTKNLVGLGIPTAAIGQMNDSINQYGLDYVLENSTFSAAQKSGIRKIFGDKDGQTSTGTQTEVLTLSEKAAKKLEDEGIETEALVAIQSGLEAGESLDDLAEELKLNASQLALIRNYISDYEAA